MHVVSLFDVSCLISICLQVERNPDYNIYYMATFHQYNVCMNIMLKVTGPPPPMFQLNLESEFHTKLLTSFNITSREGKAKLFVSYLPVFISPPCSTKLSWRVYLVLTCAHDVLVNIGDVLVNIEGVLVNIGDGSSTVMVYWSSFWRSVFAVLFIYRILQIEHCWVFVNSPFNIYVLYWILKKYTTMTWRRLILIWQINNWIIWTT